MLALEAWLKQEGVREGLQQVLSLSPNWDKNLPINKNINIMLTKKDLT